MNHPSTTAHPLPPLAKVASTLSHHRNTNRTEQNLAAFKAVREAQSARGRYETARARSWKALEDERAREGAHGQERFHEESWEDVCLACSPAQGLTYLVSIATLYVHIIHAISFHLQADFSGIYLSA